VRVVRPQHVTRPRVLLANLEPMTGLGMRRVLAEGGIEVVEEDDADGVVAQVRRVLPDAVVLGFDGQLSLDLSERVRNVVPETKVILWTRDETAMQVFDPGSDKPRRIQSGTPEALLGELSPDQRLRGEE
jgi:DNA-binding NarL/FixJ family response regulator